MHASNVHGCTSHVFLKTILGTVMIFILSPNVRDENGKRGIFFSKKRSQRDKYSLRPVTYSSDAVERITGDCIQLSIPVGYTHERKKSNFVRCKICKKSKRTIIIIIFDMNRKRYDRHKTRTVYNLIRIRAIVWNTHYYYYDYTLRVQLRHKMLCVIIICNSLKSVRYNVVFRLCLRPGCISRSPGTTFYFTSAFNIRGQCKKQL